MTEAEAFDMRTFIFKIVDKAGAAPLATPEQTAVPILYASLFQTSIFQIIAKLTDISPWCELLMLTGDGNAITLNRTLTTEDRDELFRIIYEKSRVIV